MPNARRRASYVTFDSAPPAASRFARGSSGATIPAGSARLPESIAESAHRLDEVIEPERLEMLA